jgi:uncharacterized protein
MAYYILEYEVVDDYVEQRAKFREDHLGVAQQAHKRGELVLAGAAGDPVDGAVLVFYGSSPRVAEEFAENDPYVRNGLVTRWTVRPWHVVIGGKSG